MEEYRAIRKHSRRVTTARLSESPNHHTWLSPYGNSIAGKILATRPGHFVGRRQIDPELEAVNVDAFGGDFIVDQTAAGDHPLHVAWQIVPS